MILLLYFIGLIVHVDNLEVCMVLQLFEHMCSYPFAITYRSATLLTNEKRLEAMITGQTTDVRAVRNLGKTIKNGNIKILSEAKTCPLQWFKKFKDVNEPFIAPFTEQLEAFESAIGRIAAMDPTKWTVLDMREETTRFFAELKAADALYIELVQSRTDLIELKRQAAKSELNRKQQVSITMSKLASPWVLNGANKKVCILLQDIGS